MDFQTGKVRWSQDKFGAGSVTLAGNRLLILRESGELVLAAATPVIAGGLALVIANPASAAVASSIQVKGNQRIEAETIKTYIAIKPGKSYGAAEIDASIKTLFDTGLFADVSIAQHGSVLVVTVVENVLDASTDEGPQIVHPLGVALGLVAPACGDQL